jgi:multidrug resistance efflux pump
MELLLIHTTICVAIVKIFRIPVHQWTLPTAAFGRVFLITGILLVINYNHPFTKSARIYFITTPIMPGVKGRMVEVPVKPSEPLKEGDVLSHIDSRPYEYVVDQKKALLAETGRTSNSSTQAQTEPPRWWRR